MKTKRTYKHSEAWFEKHAAKAAKAAKVTVKKNAKKTVKAKKPTKMTAEEKAAKKEAKKAAMEAKKAERLAKKEAKKLAKEKKMAATSAKKANKVIMKQANKLFTATKKCVSATKKQTKAYGKLMTEALKNGDPAIVEKIAKLFGRLGYSKLVNGNTIENTFRVEIKLPKAKQAKVDDKEKAVAPPKEQTQQTIVVEAQGPLNEDGAPATPLKKNVETSARDGSESGPSDKELNMLEKELEDDQSNSDDSADGEELADSEELDDGEEANDDSEEEETDDSRDEPDMFESSTMRDRSDAFREMEEAQHENGEWE